MISAVGTGLVNAMKFADVERVERVNGRQFVENLISRLQDSAHESKIRRPVCAASDWLPRPLPP